MTWEELQIISLQKMFETSAATLVVDDSTQDYLNAMPGAANEALLLLCTNGKYFKKTVEIVQGGDQPTAPTFSAGRYNGYDLKEMTNDFYTMYQGYITFTDGSSYGPASNYTMEGDSILLLDKNTEGVWKVRYSAYPERITKDTPKETEISLDPEAASMVALYIAGQLYKEDDVTLAQIYMNEFLQWLSALQMSAAKARTKSGGEQFHSVYGWY